jgi:hypothetical protein
VDASDQPRSVFVTAARPEDAGIAAELLRRCGLEASSVFEMQAPSNPAAGSLEQITQASGAVAAIRGGELAPGVIFELGFARGLGLPTLVLFLIGTNDDIPVLPGDVQGLQQVRWDPTSEPSVALLTRLRRLLTLEITLADGVAPVERRKSEPSARRYVDATERRAAEVLELVGAEVAAEGPGNRLGRPDLSAWFPDLPNWANPVVIEVKARDPGGRSHADAVRQLQEYLHALQLPIGIVLVPGERPPEWSAAEGTAILLLGVETLADLGPRGMRAHLARARNLVAHSA